MRIDIDSLARRLTSIEAVTVVLWLAFALVGQRFFAAATLVIGFGLEEKRRIEDITSRRAPVLLAVPIIVEVIGWVLALLALKPYGLAGVAVVLFVFLWPEHSLVGNLTSGRPLLSNIFNVKALGFSAVEAVGGAVAIALIAQAFATGNVLAYAGAVVGVAVLMYTSTAEHREGIRQAIADLASVPR
jgi:hypothetical protein